MRFWVALIGGALVLYLIARGPSCGTKVVEPTARPSAPPPPSLAAPSASPVLLPPGAAAGEVRGQVRYQDGTPAVGARVFAVSQAGLVGRAVVDNAGAFAFARLPAGRLQISASRTEGYSVRSWAEQGGGSWVAITLGDRDARTGLELTLDRGTAFIAGRVFGPGGQPVSGATVSARRERGMALADPCTPFAQSDAQVKSAADGGFVFEGLVDDKFAVGADGGRAGFAVARQVATGTNTVALSLARGAAVGGFVRDESGAPPEGWRFTFAPAASLSADMKRNLVFCWHRESGMGAFGPESFLSFFDNYPPQGRFDLWGLTAGLYDLTFTDGRGRRAVVSDLRLDPGEQKTSLDLRLTDAGGVTVVGRAQRADGSPLVGARVYSFDTHGPGDGITGADGSFTLKGAQAGKRFTLRFQTAATGDDTARSVDVPTGADAINLGDIRLGR